MSHRFDTTAVHAAREDLASLGVHVPPIDLSSTATVPDVETRIAIRFGID